LEDAVPFPVRDVLYLNDQLIRFQLESNRAPSPYQRFFMGEYSSADEVFPDDPNREAVEYNLASLAKALDAALAGAAGMSRRDVLSLNIDHHCRPTYLYTNGQAVVSVVLRNPARFEAVYHRSLRCFNAFDSSFRAQDVLMAANFEDAQRAAVERLAAVETWSLGVRKGVELDEVVFQPAGSRTGSERYPLQILMVSFRGGGFRVQTGGPPCGAHEEYRVLNELRPDGFVVEACATCQYFRFSGMTRDMSAGSAGYCTHPSNSTAAGRLTHVSVRHFCPEYTFVEDHDREHSYIHPVEE
jgi:hypothetical protein